MEISRKITRGIPGEKLRSNFWRKTPKEIAGGNPRRYSWSESPVEFLDEIHGVMEVPVGFPVEICGAILGRIPAGIS